VLLSVHVEILHLRPLYLPTTTITATTTTTATADVATRIIPAVEGEKEKEEGKQYRGLATNIPNESIQYVKKIKIMV